VVGTGVVEPAAVVHVGDCSVEAGLSGASAELPQPASTLSTIAATADLRPTGLDICTPPAWVTSS
jgi:hypothetical protein